MQRQIQIRLDLSLCLESDDRFLPPPFGRDIAEVPRQASDNLAASKPAKEIGNEYLN